MTLPFILRRKRAVAPGEIEDADVGPGVGGGDVPLESRAVFKPGRGTLSAGEGAGEGFGGGFGCGLGDAVAFCGCG